MTMRDRRKRRCAAHGVLAALMLLCTVTVPAEAQQRRTVRSTVAGVVDEIRDFVVGPPQREPPRNLRACGSLYGAHAREIARGPERLNRYNDWVQASYRVVRSIGPLPLCFESRRDTLTSNQGRYLLHVNNYYLRQHPQQSYLLTGYTDPQEASPALAQRRAEVVRVRSVEPPCRYPVRRGTATLLEHHRKVQYSPATVGCRPSPR
jgi:hypothetical protein